MTKPAITVGGLTQKKTKELRYPPPLKRKSDYVDAPTDPQVIMAIKRQRPSLTLISPRLGYPLPLIPRVSPSLHHKSNGQLSYILEYHTSNDSSKWQWRHHQYGEEGVCLKVDRAGYFVSNFDQFYIYFYFSKYTLLTLHSPITEVYKGSNGGWGLQYQGPSRQPKYLGGSHL